MADGRRRGRFAWRFVAVTAVLVVAAGAAGIPVYVRPQVDELRPADAILVLGGENRSRYTYGFQLAEEGLAPNLVISNPLGSQDRWLVKQCARVDSRFRVRCFMPDPSTTKGEGRTLRQLADENGWRTVIVVTFTPHVSRARFILAQCFDGALIMAASPGPTSALSWAFQYLYQTAGYVRALLQPGC